MTVTIHIGDSLEILRTLPSNSIHCCVTSPPYWGLRDYGVSGQMGLETSPAEFISSMVAVFEEVRRVLRPDGTCWINMGDSYSHGGHGERDKARWPKQSRNDHAPTHVKSNSGLKPKDLCMMPHRLAIALQDAGWWVRQDIVWSKPNPMPESVRDRCTKSHEYIFLLTKSERYYYDQDAILEPVSPNTHARLSQDVQSQIGSMRANGGTKTNGTMKAVGRGVGWGHGSDAEQRQRGRITTNNSVPSGWANGTDRKHTELLGNYASLRISKSGNKERKPSSARGCPEGTGANVCGSVPWEGTKRNKRSVWTMATHSFKEAHFATFPPELPETCIKAGCPVGGTVIDPFFGAGTTGLVADRLQRHCIGIELNPAYAEIARKRIYGDASLLADVQVA